MQPLPLRSLVRRLSNTAGDEPRATLVAVKTVHQLLQRWLFQSLWSALINGELIGTLIACVLFAVKTLLEAGRTSRETGWPDAYSMWHD